MQTIYRQAIAISTIILPVIFNRNRMQSKTQMSLCYVCIVCTVTFIEASNRGRLICEGANLGGETFELFYKQFISFS